MVDGAGYVRYEAAAPNGDGDRIGMFALLRALREGGQLSAADRERAAELVVRSYAVHTEPPPEHFATTPAGISWFRADAPAPVWRLVADVLQMLTDHGVEWHQVRADDPGRITYADAVQVVAVPADGANRPV